MSRPNEFFMVASPHEVKFVEKTIDRSFTQHAPDKFIGDEAYDVTDFMKRF